MRVLRDENVPVVCRRWLPGHRVETVEFRGWKDVRNGVLLGLAVEHGFDVLVTCDKDIPSEHDLAKFPTLAVVMLPTNDLGVLRLREASIRGALESVRAGAVTLVTPPPR